MPLALSLVLLALTVALKSNNILKLGLGLLVYSFFLININKEIENDLFWYSQHYLLNNNEELSNIFGVYRIGVPAKISEPIYHTFSFYLSNLTNANYTIYVLCITLFIYLGTLFFISYYINDSRLNDDNRAILLIFFVFFGIIFTQSLHLIRQYLACTLLLGSLLFLVKRKYFAVLAFSVLAFLTHNSTVIITLLFISTYFIFNFFTSKKITFYCVCVVAVITGVFYIFAFYLIGDAERLNIDDGSVSFFVKIIDLLLFIFSIYFYFKKRNLDASEEILFLLYTAFTVFVLVAHYSHFLSLRYYFYLDFFRWIPVYIMLRSLVFIKSSLVPLNMLLVLMGLVYVSLRMYSSPFDFGYTIFEYLLFPLIVI
jgi:hypothetical protein